MIAALDATPLTLTSGGLARYVAELSLALAREYPEDKYVLLSDQKFALPPNAPANLVSPSEPASGGRWWLHGVRRPIVTSGAQIFHGTNFEVPYLGRTPAILTVHDLSPWRDPKWHTEAGHSGAGRVRRRTPWLIRLRRARMILTMSEAVRHEITRYFGISASQVRAIPLAASSLFQPVETRRRSQPYFLFVGTLEPRKNLSALIAAWNEVRVETGAELLIAGRTRADFVPVSSPDGPQYLGEVSDSDLPHLLSGALALVYPTLYEGFGLPVLEAMQCGCPVITSHDPAVTELSGGALNGAAIHAGSVREIAEAMRTLAASPERRGQMRERGLARAAQFSWSRTARETRALYREVLTGAALAGVHT